jgi:manganese efflux pump family protein
MDIAALITWLITAVGGFVLLATWIARGALRSPGGSTHFPPAAVFGHVLLAVAGLVVWLAYLATDSSGAAWAAFVILIPVALLGLSLFLRWLAGRRRQVAAVPAGPAPAAVPAAATAEQAFPVAVVVLHGLLAVTTVVLVLLAALAG